MPILIMPNATKLSLAVLGDSGALPFRKRWLEAARQPQEGKTRPFLQILISGHFGVEQGAQTQHVAEGTSPSLSPNP